MRWPAAALLAALLVAGSWAAGPQPPDWKWSRALAPNERPSSRQGHSAVGLGRRVYIFGGCIQEIRCYNDVWTLDTENIVWHQEVYTGEWPEPRGSHTATLVGTDVFVYGGANNEETFSGVYKLDLVKRHWTLTVPLAPDGAGPAVVMPGRRTNHAAAADIFGRIYVFGGYDFEGKFLNDLWILSVSPKVADDVSVKLRGICHVEWLRPVVAGVLPEPREGHSLTVVDRRLMLFGGYSSHGESLNDAHMLNLDSLDWTRLHPIGALPPPRQAHAAARHGHELIILGGCDINEEHPTCHSDVWSLDLIEMRWKERSRDSVTWPPREGHSATFIRGQIFVFGGCELGFECFSDLAVLDTHDPCPANCGDNGECVGGNFCRCTTPDFTGHDCLQAVVWPPTRRGCGPHGSHLPRLVQLLQDARHKRQQAEKSRLLAEALASSPERGRMEVRAEILRLQHDVEGLTEAALTAEADARAAGGPTTDAELLALEEAADVAASFSSDGRPAAAAAAPPPAEAPGQRWDAGWAPSWTPSWMSGAPRGSPQDLALLGIDEQGRQSGDCGTPACSGHGVCQDAVCYCQPGFYGKTCSSQSTSGEYTMKLTEAVAVACAGAVVALCGTVLISGCTQAPKHAQGFAV